MQRQRTPSTPHWVRSYFVGLLICTLLSIGWHVPFGGTAWQNPATPVYAAGTTYYVKEGGSGDCLSWANACDLQTAIATATSGDEIWVAAGIYTPSEQTDPDDARTATFMLKDGVALYGGFPTNTDTATKSDRNWETNVTILSGDVDANDITAGGIITDTSLITGTNSYHVVSSSGVVSTTILDGFTITGGNADGNGYYDNNDSGGGLYNNNSSPTLTNVIISGNTATYGGGLCNYDNSHPTLTNVTISGNTADYGGGMYNYQSSPTLTNVTISGNTADYGGGGLYNNNSSPTLTNVTISDNTARFGGGLYNVGSSPTLTNVTISSNTARQYIDGTQYSGDGGGGGLYNYRSSPTLTTVTINGNTADGGGGLYNYDNSNPILTNVTISGNSADDGGGVYNSVSSPTLTNVTISGNTASGNGGGLYNGGGPTLTNVTISGNTASGNGGGLYNSSGGPTLTNVTISGNTASGNGGGLHNDYYCRPTLTNVTISGNTASWFGGGLYNTYTSNPSIINSIVWGNVARAQSQLANEIDSIPTIAYSLIEGSGGSGEHWDAALGEDQGNNLDILPQFIVPVDSTNAPTTAGDYRLEAGSPAMNAGTNAADLDGTGSFTETISDIVTDHDGNPRIVDSTVDLGAYEVQDTTDSTAPSVTIDSLITADSTPAIHGRVNDGTATIEVTINSTRYDATNNGDGTWTLADDSINSNLPNGTYEVAVTATDTSGNAGQDTTTDELTIDTTRAILYATPDGSAGTTCQSWDDACDIQTAIATAYVGSEVWVAEGIYYPTDDGDPTVAFTLTNGVALYGGFPANADATTTKDDRNWEANPTILSGDIDQNDVTANGVVTDTANISGTNSYHVVYSSGVMSTTILDGFTITGGAATSDTSFAGSYGGGLSNWQSHPTLTNMNFSGNHATINGGGLSNWQSSPTLTNVTISGNSAKDGGGLYNGESSPTLTNVIISDNTTSGSGGGLYNDYNSNPILTNVTISDNTANDGGGGLYNSYSNPTLTDVTISGNTANGKYSGGGGLYNSYSSPNLNDVTINDNTAAENGGGLYNNYNSDPILTNVTISSNTASGNGGGLSNSGRNSTLTNVTISSNTAAKDGGGVYNISGKLTNVTISGNTAQNGGGMFNGSSNLTLTNVTISGNTATKDGGGMYNKSNSYFIKTTLTNVTISGNSAAENGGGLYNASSISITNSIIWGNMALAQSQLSYGSSIAHSLIEGSGGSGEHWDTALGIDAGNNLDIIPQFVAPVDAIHAPTTTGDYRLEPGSPAINAGTNTADLDGTGSFTETISDIATDRDGKPRIVDGTVDLGAYEVQATTDSTAPSVTVDSLATLDTTPTLSGRVNDGTATVEVTINSISYPATNHVNGTWTLPDDSINSDLPNGTYDVAVTATDTSGNAGQDTTTNELIIDTTRAILYAIPDGSASTTCQSWDTACDLQTAIATAYVGSEVWVAEGIYYPTDDGDPTVAFTLTNGVALYGGFPASAEATTTKADRNWEANPTILNGDIDHNDSTAAGVVTDTTHINGTNSYHVVYSSGVMSTTILDGFTITGGAAKSDSSFMGYYGGGLFNWQSHPTLANVTFKGNYATRNGGGLSNWHSRPTLTNVTIIGNTALWYGGGLYNSYSFPMLTNVTIIGNTANDSGGGLYNSYSSPMLTNVTIGSNTVNDSGGGLMNSYSSPTLTNVTISGNMAEYGGGMFNSYNSNPTLTNVIVISNTVSEYGGGMYNEYSSGVGDSNPILSNCILWGNIANGTSGQLGGKATITFSIVQGDSVYPGANNSNTDPCFVDADGADDIIGTDDDNLRLQATSPAIDRGDNAAINATGVTTDFDGADRIVDGDADGTPTVDIGAYEYHLTADAGSPQTVAPGANVTLDGSGSSDLTGNPITYGWEQTGGERVSLSDSSTASPSFTAPIASGVLTFSLTVMDRVGLSDSDSVTITVERGNAAPIANAGSPQTVAPNITVTLNGSGSSDPNGDRLTYGWAQTGGASITLSDSRVMSPTFTAPATSGVLTFSLTVTDTGGLSNSDSITITVERVNAAPIANAGSPQTVAPGASVTLDGSGSSDPNDDRLTYDWEQTGGASITLSDSRVMSPTFTTPATSGVLTFSLTVTDTGGLSNSDSVTVTVMPTTGEAITPTVTSIVWNPDSPINAATMAYTVTFNVNVHGVDSTDFAVVTTGSLTNTAITAVEEISGTTYVVMVDTGTGNGTMRLHLRDNDSITSDDAYQIPLGGTGMGNGDATSTPCTIIKAPSDRPAITVEVALATGQLTRTNTLPIDFTVTFSETVEGFAANHVQITGVSGTPAVTLTSVSDTQYRVSVGGAIANGDIVTMQIPANVVTASDGTPNAASNTVQVTYQTTSPAEGTPKMVMTARSNGIIAPGQVLRYTLVYTNSGAGMARNVRLTAQQPDGTTFAPTQSNDGWQQGQLQAVQYTYPVGDVAAGTSNRVTFAVVVGDNYVIGTAIENVFALSGENVEGVTIDSAQDTTNTQVISMVYLPVIVDKTP